MSERTAPGRGKQTPMAIRSPVGWTLLGLVIEAPGYGHELLQRYEAAYEDTLPLGSSAQIYEALDSLQKRELIRELGRTGEGPPGRRQSKLRYRATAKGVHAYQDWLVSQAREERRRSRLVTIQLAALAPQEALEVIDRYQVECLESVRPVPGADALNAEGAQPRADQTGSRRQPAVDPSARKALSDRLVNREERLVMSAKLNWIEYARRELRRVLEPQGARAQPPGPVARAGASVQRRD